MPAFFLLRPLAIVTTIKPWHITYPTIMKRPVTSLALVTLFGSLSAPVLAESTLYSWEDENGVVHFTDQPQPDAQPLIIKAPKIQTPPPTTEPAAQGDQPIATQQPTATSDEQEAVQPEVTLVSPSHEATLRDNSGNITVVASSPLKLNKGHSVQLRIDDQIFGRPQTQLRWQLTNIDRGSHTLQVDLLKYGKVIASSEKITVYLHRARVNQHVRPAPSPK